MKNNQIINQSVTYMDVSHSRYMHWRFQMNVATVIKVIISLWTPGLPSFFYVLLFNNK